MTPIRTPLAALLLLALAGSAANAQTSRNVTLLAHIDSYNEYSAGCSYVHSDGREYACLGTDTGTAIYRVTVPTAPVLVAFIPGPNSVWREMKPFGDHVYIVSEGSGAGAGLQIVRMTNPDAPVLATTWTGQFTTAHTVTIDKERAILWANGANGSAGGTHALSLANPEAPVWLGAYYTHYAHDSHVRGNRLYLASIYEGYEIVLDVTNPAAIIELALWQTPGKFTHNSWMADDGVHLFTTDENATGFLTVYDVSNLAAVTEVAQFSANPNAIVHNVRIKGDTAFVSHYTEGVRLLDISDPTTPVEFGYYDTWPGPSGGFDGNWDVDPFFESGIFMVTDITSGLWLFRAEPNYGLVQGVVTESGPATPLAGVDVTAAGTGSTFKTYAAGRFSFALDPGSWTLDFEKFGFYPATSGISVTAGQTVTVNRSMIRIPSGSVSGTVTGGVAQTPLADARLHLHETPLATISTGMGAYTFPDVPENTYLLEADRPGYLPRSQNVVVTGGNNTTVNLNLTALNYYDNSENATGWALSAVGDNATAGRWVRADPIGTGPQAPSVVPLRNSFQVKHDPQYENGPLSGQPEDDNTPFPGTICFITANGAVGGSVGAADVDNGRTTLVTPTFTMAGTIDPHVTFYYWYVNDVGSNPGQDAFDIAVSNNGGTTWVPVASILQANHAWEAFDFRLLDFVAPTATMKVRFIAQDLLGGSVVEAGVDDFGWYEPVPQSSTPNEPRPTVMAGAITAGPNPFLVAAELSLEMASAGRLDVRVFSAAGRLVRTLHEGESTTHWSARWDGRDDHGLDVPPGVYFVRAAGPAFERSTRIVRLR